MLPAFLIKKFCPALDLLSGSVPLGLLPVEVVVANTVKFPVPTDNALEALFARADSASEDVNAIGAKVIAAVKKGRRATLVNFMRIALLSC